MGKIQSIGTIFIVDDHPSVRLGLATALRQEHFEIVAQEATVPHALARLRQIATPRLALIDLTLETQEGFGLIGAFRERGALVLVHSMREDSESIERSFSSGANGYVSKREEIDILLKGVHAVLAGSLYIGPRAAQTLATKIIRPQASATALHCTQREREVLDLLGEGFTKTDIANRLSISPRTVDTYCARIREKLEFAGMKDLRQFAIRRRQR